MGIRAVLLDVFGTLLDVHSVAARVEHLFPGHGAALSQLWREKQLEYTRLRTLCDRYVPFTQVTEEALLYDTLVAGYKNDVINSLRLWAAKASQDQPIKTAEKDASKHPIDRAEQGKLAEGADHPPA